MGVTVGVQVGFTLNLGNFQSAKYDLSVNGLNPELPLEPQLASAESTIKAASAWLEDRLFERLRENGLVEAVRTRQIPK